MTILNNTSKRKERGSAAIEFALVLPILIILLAFTLFFGRLFWHYTVALKAAHDAATFLGMSRIAETSIIKTDLGEIEVAKIAKAIAVMELAELNPGKGAMPIVEVNCDRYQCSGDKITAEISVMGRMNMFDPFLSGITDEITGPEGLMLYAEVREPYVGH
jgi:hypothetical protein